MPGLPNFVVIGAPKSGTTSLFYYLKQHPEIFLPTRKELHYFAFPQLEKHACGPGDRDTLSALCSTREAYEKHYASIRQEKAVGDVSPSYLYYANDVAERILQELGRVKIIAILRDPAEKAFSQYMHLVRDHRENLGFYEALLAEQGRREAGWSDIWRYVESSLYSERLAKYVAVFGQENVKVLLFSDLVENPQAVTRDVFRFLGVDEDYKSDTERIYNRTGTSRSKLISEFLSRPNPVKSVIKRAVPERLRISLRLALLNWNTGGKGEMDAASREYLEAYFKNDIAALKDILARQLEHVPNGLTSLKKMPRQQGVASS